MKVPFGYTLLDPGPHTAGSSILMLQQEKRGLRGGTEIKKRSKGGGTIEELQEIT